MARLIMVGKCPSCGQTVRNKYPFEIGECKCSNPHIEVHLEPALILSPRYMKAIEADVGDEGHEGHESPI